MDDTTTSTDAVTEAVAPAADTPVPEAHAVQTAVPTPTENVPPDTDMTPEVSASAPHFLNYSHNRPSNHHCILSCLIFHLFF